MTYDEFLERMDKLNQKDMELEIEKCSLVDEFISQMRPKSGDLVEYNGKEYRVLDIEYDFYAEDFILNAELADPPGEYEQQFLYCFNGEQIFSLKIIEEANENEDKQD